MLAIMLEKDSNTAIELIQLNLENILLQCSFRRVSKNQVLVSNCSQLQTALPSCAIVSAKIKTNYL